jgi:protease I
LGQQRIRDERAGMTSEGKTTEAGEGLSDEEMVEQVAEQTSSDIREADVFKREADGTTTDTEAAKASGDEWSED